MKMLLLASTIVSGMLIAPAFAQMASDMSCADFTAMDSSGQMAAVESMASGMASDKMAPAGNMTSDAMGSDKMGVTTENVAQACAGQSDMMVHDAMEKAKIGK
jgi:hypothetical protein